MKLIVEYPRNPTGDKSVRKSIKRLQALFENQEPVSMKKIHEISESLSCMLATIAIMPDGNGKFLVTGIELDPPIRRST